MCFSLLSSKSGKLDHRCIVSSLVLIVIICSNVSAGTPRTINFDNLPSWSYVVNQYPEVWFSANGFRGGYGYTYNTYAAPSGAGTNHLMSGLTYYLNDPNVAHSANLFLDFAIPVNNLRFNMINPSSVYGSVVTASVHIYVNRQYHSSIYINGYNTSQPSNLIPVNISAISDITGIWIDSVWNYSSFYGRYYSLYYDDFTFTPNLDVNIVNPRVSGNLNGTTQNAMLGADVVLQASVQQTNLQGGTYSWSITDTRHQL